MNAKETLQALRFVLPAAILTLPLSASTALSSQSADKLRLSAFAVDLNRPGRAAAGNIEIAIERWSSQAEADRLEKALQTKGEDGVLAALTSLRPRVGYIRNSTSIGWDLYFARETVAADGSRRIYIATDRPIGMREAWTQPRSVDYRFTLAEIHLNKDGKGLGKLVNAARVTYKKGTHTLEIEDYQTEPVRLNAVEVVRESAKRRS
jgi:hypothetical protein